LRAVAIAGVFAYHLGYGWAAGGYLGVDLFFVLSGFLITSLLVEEWAGSGRIRIGAFWGRRALRLLPALVVMLLALGAFLAFFGPGPLVDLHAVRNDAVATVLYVANWHQLFAHQSYFDRYAAPSPLQHTWSLGIEEQFYVIWPIVVLGLLAVARRARLSWRRLGISITGVAAAASAGWMAWLTLHGASLNRIYYGTDTRAFDLLCGAVVAWWVAYRPQPSATSRRWLSLATVPAVALLVLCWWRGGNAGTPSRWRFEWGFLASASTACRCSAGCSRSSPSKCSGRSPTRCTCGTGRSSAS
jgi:peptidoglycan/LPS O-acetylase OafA/YrhL